MARNNSGKNNDPLNELLQGNENSAAKLAVIAGIVTTLGDVLATTAAVIALEELQSQDSAPTNNGVSVERFKELEKQVHYLTKELNKLKYPRK
ncbi:hypothetical protein AAGS61_01945 [Lysinibacillus sp. KU-BSD001]|uniref:hypothetical protein n=1 Tax=Lysinibacillus sp. KU-BSD001 TaxID=3141328 RepID=UPI0036ED1D94